VGEGVGDEPVGGLVEDEAVGDISTADLLRSLALRIQGSREWE
jgi:hypothetical protein